MISLADGSSLAHLGYPDMKVPIAYALHWPERANLGLQQLNLVQLGALTFEPVDHEAFPCLALAIAAGEQGGTAPCVLNAANEIAVAAFLARECGFRDIARCAEQVCMEFARNGDAREPESIADALALDRAARDCARKFIAMA